MAKYPHLSQSHRKLKNTNNIQGKLPSRDASEEIWENFAQRNMDISHGFHLIYEKLLQEGIDARTYRQRHKLIGSSQKHLRDDQGNMTEKKIPRDTIDGRIKKEILHLYKSLGVKDPYFPLGQSG